MNTKGTTIEDCIIAHDVWLDFFTIPVMNAYIGLSGWSYKEWKGIFYPDDIKSTLWLEYYTKFFNTVEINASFYRMPRAQTVVNWTERVPEGFIFCPKMSRYITHIKRLKDCAEPLEYFFEIFEPMRERMGPVLIQLHPGQKFEYSRTEGFFEILKKQYSKYDFAIEGRHPTWLNDNAFDLMARYDIAWVISQSGVGFPYSEVVTAKNVYIRFHGPGKLYASNYTNMQLQEWADKCTGWLNKGLVVWAYFNNTAKGHALKNAEQLKEMLQASIR